MLFHASWKIRIRRIACVMLFKIQDSSRVSLPCTQIIKKGAETCIVLVRKRTASRRESYARGRRSLIRTFIRSLSQLTKPHLALSYLTSFAVRRVLQCLASPRNPFAHSPARAHSCVAQIPLSLVATALLRVLLSAHTHA